MKNKYGLLVNDCGGINPEQFRESVSVNAYYRAEKRDFEPGHDIDDWHEAVTEITSRYRYPIRDLIK